MRYQPLLTGNTSPENALNRDIIVYQNQALDVFRFSGLKPTRIVLNMSIHPPGRVEQGYRFPDDDYLVGSENLEIRSVDSSHFLETYDKWHSLTVLKVFGGYMPEHFRSLLRCDYQQFGPRRRPRLTYPVEEAGFLDGLEVPHIRELSLSEMRDEDDRVAKFVRKHSRTLRRLTLKDFGVDGPSTWHKLFQAVRDSHEDLIFHFERLRTCSTHFWYCDNKDRDSDVHMCGALSENDRELIAFLESKGPWTENLSLVWRRAGLNTVSP